MSNDNNKKSDLAIRKAKLMSERRRYYAQNGRDSEFAGLPGHLQRAVEREANFQLDSMIKSDSYIEHLDNDNAKQLFQAHCEYYAHIGLEQDKVNPHNPQNLFKRLLERDSDANRNREFLKGEESYARKSERHSHTIDNSATKGNVPEHISAMLQKQRIRVV